MIIKDHKNNLNRELSLVEQKKMQWAKEREEMAKLEQYHSRLASKYERNSIRTQMIAHSDVFQSNNFHQKSYPIRRVRSPSLPPIEKTMTRQGSNNSDHSSGYLSSSGGNGTLPMSSSIDVNFMEYKYGSSGRVESLDVKLPLNNLQQSKKLSLTSSLNDFSSSSTHNDAELDEQKSPISPSSETSSITSHDIDSISSFAHSTSVDPSTNYHHQQHRNGRAKWGSYLFDAFSKDNGRNSRNLNGPGWLEKSLSEARDSEDETMSISMRSVSSFLRGQNVPVDPEVMAEREIKRRKAVELQHAIQQQLQERENLRRIEREKQLLIEKKEEERAARIMEKERQRIEFENNLQFEKVEAERKREEAMRKALEKAAVEAQKEKERKRRERVAMQAAIDETISVQKIGEKTPEIKIFEKLTKDETFDVEDTSENGVEIELEITQQSPIIESPKKCETSQIETDENGDNEEEEDDGETVLIGTPIKLRKKNLDTYRKKFAKQRQQRVEERERFMSDDEKESSQTKKTTENSHEKQSSKIFSDIDNLALLLQSMPLVPIVPISPELIGFNNLALMLAAQTRMNTPSNNKSIDKIDISQFLMPPCSPQTITLQIQQVELKSDEEPSIKIESIPPTPDTNTQKVKPSEMSEKCEDLPPVIPPSPLPHEGTFTIHKEEETQTNDACTSTTNNVRFFDEPHEREVRILTPQKYRSDLRSYESLQTIGTQTESFLFCEYCSYQHQQHRPHHQQCVHNSSQAEDTDGSQMESLKECESEKKPTKVHVPDNRPKWGVRNPPMKYLKASERDPWHGRNRKRRYLKKTFSEGEKSEDNSTCPIKECPLMKSPLSQTSHKSIDRDEVCKNLLPLKYDRFGRLCVMDEQKFLENEAFRRVGHLKCESYATTSDAESSIIDLKHRSFFPRGKDFQDIFVD